jgi:hypothetical protein
MGNSGGAAIIVVVNAIVAQVPTTSRQSPHQPRALISKTKQCLPEPNEASPMSSLKFLDKSLELVILGSDLHQGHFSNQTL